MPGSAYPRTVPTSEPDRSGPTQALVTWPSIPQVNFCDLIFTATRNTTTMNNQNSIKRITNRISALDALRGCSSPRPAPIRAPQGGLPAIAAGIKSLQCKIRYLNLLPLLEPDLPHLNRWTFGVCRLDHAGDFVFAKHPYLHDQEPAVYGPTKILRETNSATKAKNMLELMLDAVLAIDEVGFLKAEFAPSSWAIIGKSLAADVQEACIQYKVRDHLRTVGVCTSHERRVLEFSRDLLFYKHDKIKKIPLRCASSVSLGDNSKCHGCGRHRESFFTPLVPYCCDEAFYHSEGCRKASKPDHLDACRCYFDWEHFIMEAPHSTRACALVKSLHLPADVWTEETTRQVHIPQPTERGSSDVD